MSNVVFEGTDFVIPEAPKKRSVCLFFGEPGTGKTTTALNTPSPIAVFTFDRRGADAIQEARDNGKIVGEIDMSLPLGIRKMNEDGAKKMAEGMVAKFFKNLEQLALLSTKGKVRTIVIDTATELDELINYSLFGKGETLKGDYGKSVYQANLVWGRVFSTVRNGDAHTVFLARGKDEWKSGEPTGRVLARGPKILSQGVDWSAELRLKKRVKGKEQELEMRIEKAGLNLQGAGEVYDKSLWEDMGGPFVCGNVMQNLKSDMGDWQ
jgi:AAA domain